MSRNQERLSRMVEIGREILYNLIMTMEVKMWNRIQFSDTYLAFNQMEEFLELLECSVKERIKEVQEGRDLEDFSVYPNDNGFLMQEYFDYQEDIAEIYYPKFFLSSFIISWFSYIEKKILDHCVFLKRTIEVKPQENLNIERGIHKAKTFLEFGVEDKMDNVHWQELKKIQLLRNVLVHRGDEICGRPEPYGDKYLKIQRSSGEINFPIKKHLFDYMESKKIVKLENVRIKIYPSFDYCRGLAKFGEKLFYGIYETFN